MARILLVEDNEMNRDMLARRLTSRGHVVITAVDGQSALDASAKSRPDLIIMDLRLPDISGLEVARRLKSQSRTQGIPILALTAHAMESDRAQALAAGCDDYDVKPVDLPRLLDKIAALVSMEEFILIRHGESEANVGLSDHPDCALTPRGIEQARAAAQRLAAFDLSRFNLRVSPYTRARCTADLLSKSIGRRFQVEPLIREWGKECSIDGVCYPTETREQLVQRIKAFYATARGQRFLIVSHAAPIAVMLQVFAGNEPHIEDNCFWEGIENCCLYHLRNGQLTVR